MLQQFIEWINNRRMAAEWEGQKRKHSSYKVYFCYVYSNRVLVIIIKFYFRFIQISNYVQSWIAINAREGMLGKWLRIHIISRLSED